MPSVRLPTVFHPWRALRLATEITLAWQARPGLLGTYVAGSVVLHPWMNQAERRSTLTHELVHHERGIVTGDLRAVDREEKIVDEIAARRLIPLDKLIDAMLWAGNEWELADELWVDVPTVLTRLKTLTDAEHQQINQRIYADEEHLPWD